MPFVPKKGESFQQHVGILLHCGDATTGRVAERYQQLIAASSIEPRPVDRKQGTFCFSGTGAADPRDPQKCLSFAFYGRTDTARPDALRTVPVPP